MAVNVLFAFFLSAFEFLCYNSVSLSGGKNSSGAVGCFHFARKHFVVAVRALVGYLVDISCLVTSVWLGLSFLGLFQWLVLFLVVLFVPW